jgi:hypothetical protein
MPLFLLFLGATLVPRSLRPLDYLGIGYPRVLRYTHFIVPALALIAVLSFRRSPIAAFVIVLLGMLALTSVPNWTRTRAAKVPITHTIDSDAFEAWEKELGFKVWQRAGGRTDGGRGPEMWVDLTPGRAERVADEVNRMGIARP